MASSQTGTMTTTLTTTASSTPRYLVLFLVTLLHLLGAGHLRGARAQSAGHRGGGAGAEVGVPVRVPAPDPACGTKFVDALSSALLADVVLQGSVQDLRQVSPVAPLLYKAKVSVHKVYKGQGLLAPAARSNSDPRNSSRNSQSSKGSQESHDLVVQVERFGPTENRENCVAHVEKGQSYLFFLRVKDATPAEHAGTASVNARPSSSTSSSFSRNRSGSSGVEVGVADSLSSSSSSRKSPVLVNTALPTLVDMKTLRQVEKVLCPDCSSVPVILKLRCVHCAVEPSMTKPMSSSSTKTVREGKRLALRCVAKGHPKPSYVWVKDGVLLYHQEKEEEKKRAANQENSVGDERDEEEADESGGDRRRSRKRGKAHEEGEGDVFRSGSLTVRSTRQRSLLVVNKVTPEDQGTYMCLASNAVGETEQHVRVEVKEDPRLRSKSKSSPPASRSRPSPADLEPPHSAAVGEEGGGGDGGDNDDDDITNESDGEGLVVNDLCAFNPCYHGGSCSMELEDAGLAEGAGGGAGRRRVVCHCPPQHHGSRCQFKRRAVVIENQEDDEEEEVDAVPGARVKDGREVEEGEEEESITFVGGSDGDDFSEGPIQTPPDHQSINTKNEEDAADPATRNQSQPSPTRTYSLLTTNETDVQALITPDPRPSRPNLSKKLRRKYGNSSPSANESGVRYEGGKKSSSSQSGAPQLQLSECPPEDAYCFNGGTCQMVAKLQRRFCRCPPGFAGRQCEQSV